MPVRAKYSKYRLQPSQPLLSRLKVAIIACGGKQTDIATTLGLSPAYVCKLIQANNLQDDIKAARGDRKSVSRKQKQRRPLGDDHPLVKKLKTSILQCDGKQTEVAKMFNLSTPEISKLIQANHLREFAAAVRRAKRKRQKIATLEPASILLEMRRADEKKEEDATSVIMTPSIFSNTYPDFIRSNLQRMRKRRCADSVMLGKSTKSSKSRLHRNLSQYPRNTTQLEHQGSINAKTKSAKYSCQISKERSAVVQSTTQADTDVSLTNNNTKSAAVPNIECLQLPTSAFSTAYTVSSDDMQIMMAHLQHIETLQSNIAAVVCQNVSQSSHASALSSLCTSPRNTSRHSIMI